MDGKKGLVLLWTAGVLAAVVFGRDYIHERFKTVIQEAASQSPPPEFDFDKPLEFTMDQPVIPDNFYYHPEKASD